MNRHLKLLAGSLAAAAGLVSCTANDEGIVNDALRLSFSEPASTWEECVPLGNGRLGAMPDGAPGRETIVLNEESMWSGSEWDPANPEALEWLPAIREKLREGDNAAAQDLTFRHFTCSGRGGENPRYGCYQTLGKLVIEYGGQAAGGGGYSRSLSLRDAVATTADASLLREYFVSMADDVIVVHLKSNASPLDFEISLERPQDAESARAGSTATMCGTLPSGEAGKKGVSYFCEARKVVLSDSEALVLATAATDYLSVRDGTPLEQSELVARVRKTLDEASAMSYDELKARHIAEHRKYFDRVSVRIGDAAAPDSAALYLQYGRYLLIASSARAVLPPNLQGIWADGVYTPWNGDYHMNINVQMNHWPMEPGNLSDLCEPFTSYIEDIVPSGERTARDFYGTGGWAAHVLANAWRFTAPAENPSWGSSFTGGAWAALQLWEHYQFTLDEEYLRRVYPVLKGAAEFLASNLFVFNDEGWLVTGPSTSPENRYRTTDGRVCSICAGPVMDTQICQEIFVAVRKASEVLGEDVDFAARLEMISGQLPPMQISPDGYLQEWLEDYEEVEPEHRHVSHLFGLYPGTTLNTDELKDAARETLRRRGDAGTGWSRAWKINFWARLGDGNHAYRIFRNLLEPVRSSAGGFVSYSGSGAGTFPNLFCAHPPFQIDGNFGGSAGIMEMLLQSHEVRPDGTRVISVLPAIPDEWQSGSFSGLRARGGITVACRWRRGRIVSLRIDNPDNVPIEVVRNK